MAENQISCKCQLLRDALLLVSDLESKLVDLYKLQTKEKLTPVKLSLLETSISSVGADVVEEMMEAQPCSSNVNSVRSVPVARG